MGTKKAATKPATKATTTPAVVAPITKGKAANAASPPSMANVSYVTGAAKYNPRVGHTVIAWQAVQQTLGIKGKATHAALCAALSNHSSLVGQNHHDFIGYMVRRGALAIAS